MEKYSYEQFGYSKKASQSSKIVILTPTIFAIYLVLISSFPSEYLRKRVKTCYSKKEGFKDKTDVMADVALDWAIVLGYISSMISSLVSLLTTYLYTKTATFPIVAAIILIFIFVPTIWWVFSFEPGALVSTYNKHFQKLTDEKVCDLILITTYVFLGISQLLATR